MELKKVEKVKDTKNDWALTKNAYPVVSYSKKTNSFAINVIIEGKQMKIWIKETMIRPDMVKISLNKTFKYIVEHKGETYEVTGESLAKNL